MNELRTEIENTVYDGLAEIWCITREQAKQRFSLDYRPKQDKEVDPDDIDMVLVPDLHNKFKIKIPAIEWSKVGSIREVVELIARHITEAPDRKRTNQSEKGPKD